MYYHLCEVFSLRFFVKTCYKNITCDNIETHYEHVSMNSMTIEIVLCILNVKVATPKNASYAEFFLRMQCTNEKLRNLFLRMSGTREF